MRAKKRSKLGKWIDQNSYTQQDLVKATKLDKGTISKLCNDSSYIPNGKTIRKIMDVLKKIDRKLKTDDFFDI